MEPLPKKIETKRFAGVPSPPT
uniref:Uncharacterized protein n=1 Tax=Arundo donax TaxID=35708 RepID=A0A0A9BCS8_ARUDO